MKKAIISVKGTQKNDQNESDTIELITEGSFYIKGNTFYVVYEESELSGMDGTTTTLKITEDKVTLLRFGTNKSKMVFEKNKRYESGYDTPYGKILLGILPKDVKVTMSETGGEITIKYALDLNNKTVSNNELYLKVREVN
ncbi:Uncharacterized beta-barrel protein YwiB, DUF1934 family [Thermoanaerobacter uzonensis DSM 18761]|uniref:Uncharacterized beta-barrel protein YwiB, DUF1934 family n=1 Tax=Thermoanaerobacter uzonensis DSM 18761 TaxID=1123369 RepID=A0A1M4XDM3_9THEO|nr:DUF1934 domain-containing protein [Thermoanaerobacter uzonensis]SHE91657.1 Uncharacterized beta-barrel protein YwiB, DUF1934 family [Thermoanaerobacter uzonensis DSM 18761]